METKEYPDGQAGRDVLGAMISNTEVLRAVAPHWPEHGDGLFLDRIGDQLGKMCVQHFRKHDKAPGKLIVKLACAYAERRSNDKEFEAKADSLLQQIIGESRWVGDALRTGEDDVKASFADTDYWLEAVERYFEKVRLARLAQALTDAVAAGDPKQMKAAADAARDEPPIMLGGASRRFSEIPLVALDWIWEGWLPCGKLVMIDGFPGVGKGFIGIDLAARLSKGWPMPTGGVARKPAYVIIASNEDDGDDTVGPRLLAAGADLGRVIELKEYGTSFPRDLGLLESAIKKYRPALVILDPIMSMIGDAKTDSNKDADVRRYLEPLRALAKKYGVCILMVRHFTKHGIGAVYRGGGSVAWSAACRLTHVAGPAKQGDDTMVLAPGKSNLGEMPKALGFEKFTTRVLIGSGGNREFIDVGKLAWTGPVDATAEDVAAADRPGRGRPRQVESVADVIKRLLAGGPVKSDELLKTVRDETDCSERSYTTARKEVGVKSRREGFGAEGSWVSFIPKEDDPKEDEDGILPFRGN